MHQHQRGTDRNRCIRHRHGHPQGGTDLGPGDRHKLNTAPQYNRQHHDHRNQRHNFTHTAQCGRKSFNQYGHSDMLASFDRHGGAQKGSPHQAVAGKFLGPEQREIKDVTKNDLQKNHHGHGRKNEDQDDFGDSIERIANSMQGFSQILGNEPR